MKVKKRITCVKFSLFQEWMDCSGTESYLLKRVPVDVPPLLQPKFKDLEKTIDSLNCAKNFMKPSQFQWWTNFLHEKENEGNT